MSISDKKYKIVHNEAMGRHLVAERDIHPGEIIIDEPPLVTGPVFNPTKSNVILQSSDSSDVCLVCCSLIKHSNFSTTCDKCKLILCSSTCVQNSVHTNQECLVFQKLPRNLTISNRKTLYNFIIIIRCLFLRISLEENPRKNVKWVQINQLESKMKALEKAGTFTEFDNLFGLLKWEFFSPCIEGISDNFEDIKSAAKMCHGVMRINAFSSFTPTHGREGLYFLSSLMAHSCLMNTDRLMNRDQMVTRAAVEIKKGDIISTSYLSYMNPTPERLMETQSTWLFDCRCKRCLDPTECGTHLSTIACPICAQITFLPHLEYSSTNNNDNLNERGLSPTSESERADSSLDLYWKCVNESCGHALKNSQGKSPSTLEIVENARPSKLENIDEIENWLTSYCENDDKVKLVHPNHSIFIQIKIFLSQYYGRHLNGISSLSSQQLLKKIKYCSDVLRVFNTLFNGIYIIRGVVLFELWSSLQEVRRRNIIIINETFSEIDYSVNKIEEIRAEAINILDYALPNSMEESMAQILRDEG